MLPTAAWAVAEGQPIHSSGDREVWDRRANKVELFGHAMVSQPGETLSADYISLDHETRTLVARGHCLYVTADSMISGEEIDFNLDTRTGVIVGGRVANRDFTLTGERINKLGEGRFQSHWGEYTTCVDCPQAWTLQAEDIDLQFEGYAFMSNVATKIKDVPSLWIPYLILPIKTKRQTGLLFPHLTFAGTNGFTFVEPFFWAISRSFDMTFGGGVYAARGPRAEWEGRYALAPQSHATADVFFVNDAKFVDVNANPVLDESGNAFALPRWAVSVNQVQGLPWGFSEKLKLAEMSDNYYPLLVGDVPGAGDLNQRSTLSLSKSSNYLSGFVEMDRIRNLFDTNPDAYKRALEFDPRTVQAYPNVSLSTGEHQLFGLPVFGGISAGFENFTRTAGVFDYDDSSVPFGTAVTGAAPAYNPGVDPLREAMRFSYTPTLYTVVRPFHVFSLVPSLRYYGFAYDFPQGSVAPLSRGYLLFQADFEAQIERIFEVGGGADDSHAGSTKFKHLIRPILTYSNIPFHTESDPNHPFLQQITYAQNKYTYGGAYYFDDSDIVPYGQTKSGLTYFVPLGNALTYGLTTQLIRRDVGAGENAAAAYSRIVELRATQAIDFNELTKPAALSPHPFGQFAAGLDVAVWKLASSTTYTYDPTTPQTGNSFSTTLTFVLERGTHQGLLTYDRSASISYGVSGTSESIALGLSYSLSDFILPTFSINYDILNAQILSGNAGLVFQSGSRCWRLGINVAYTPATGLIPGIDFTMNFTGSGYGSFGDLANQVTGRFK